MLRGAEIAVQVEDEFSLARNTIAVTVVTAVQKSTQEAK